MGMFDSFHVDIEGKTYEVQTKQFFCLLDVWYIGDTVNDSPLTNVIVEEIYELDRYFAGIIYQGIFVDYLIRDTHEKATEDGAKLMKLYMSEINNPVVDHLVKALHEKTEKLNNLNERKSSVLAGMSNVIEFLEKDKDNIFMDENLDDKQKEWHYFLHRTWEDAPVSTVSMEEKYKYILTKIKNRAKMEFPECLPWSYNEETGNVEQEIYQEPV